MWKIVQCAVQGRSHIKADIPCQDKTFALVKNEVYVIALADGAGSAKLSHFGAECVTKFICNELSDNFDKYFNSDDGVSVKKELTSKIWITLDETARKYESNIQEFASTLMFVAVKDDRFIIAHLGDGVIGYTKNDELKVASEPDNGEFANTTVFTTSKNSIMYLKLLKGTLGDINGFVLMSDGTSAALYNKSKKQLSNGIKKIMNLWKYVSSEHIEHMLNDSFNNVIRQTTTDDCSICIMSLANTEFQGYCALDLQEKAKLLHIKSDKSLKRQIERYDTILTNLTDEKDLKYISKLIHLKPKYTKKYVNKLLNFNFIQHYKGKYRSIIMIS